MDWPWNNGPLDLQTSVNLARRTIILSRLQREEWLRQYTNWLWWRAIGQK